MPIYEYKCQDCGKITEVFVRKLDHKGEVVCSHCQSKNLQKIFSTPSTVLIAKSSSPGSTCCGREERCQIPPCSSDGTCRRD